MKKQILKIVKIGGKLIENEESLSAFLQDFSQLDGAKILVHGGGKIATELSDKLGYKTNMIEGRRITDANAMNVITMVYAGLINKKIVAKLQGLKSNAVGLCGADGKSIVSKKRVVKEIDYGFVGDVEKINAPFISSLLEKDIIPVFSAISCSTEGELFNTNADSVAAEIAIAFSENYQTELFFCFEKNGVLKNPLDDNSVIELLDTTTYQNLLDENIISEGMLPKLHNCFYALENSVSEVYLGGANLLQNGIKHTKIIK
ncbi:N-acetylglutamate kinase [Gillisia sp. Hel_I_86]|uniref:acetylglutamate kinase n=1 Tax=Gillisia sp. Hel_I_86 TaxID=1249981 RepID=UPI00119BC432|nr:acetylglutamate kinase [Gillisia sp. Hel_I_86]TVZ25277.1 N-acetylglutamate kinase [Gillisia sp. Hel_I_86]